MSKPTDLSAARSLELLHQLDRAIADHVQREDQLISHIGERRFNAERQLRKQSELLESIRTTEGEKKLAQLEVIAGRIDTTHQKRKAWLEEFAHVTRRDIQVLAQNARENYLGTIQGSRIKAERDLKNALAIAATALDERTAALATERDALLELDRRAHAAFSGYASLSSLLQRDKSDADTAAKAAAEVAKLPFSQALTRIQELVALGSERLTAFQALALPKLFRFVPLIAWLLITIVLGLVAAIALGMDSLGQAVGTGIAIGGSLVIFIVFLIGRSQGASLAKSAAEAINQAIQLLEATKAASAAQHEFDYNEAKTKGEAAKAIIELDWERAPQIEEEYRVAVLDKIKHHVPRALATNDRVLKLKRERIAAGKARVLAHLRGESDEQLHQHQANFAATSQEIDADETQRWADLVASWQTATAEPYAELLAIAKASERNTPAWSPRLVSDWQSPTAFTPSTRFAQLAIDFARHPSGLPKDPRLPLPGPAQLTAPISLAFPQGGSLLLETSSTGDSQVVGTINNIMLRLLANTPPGKINFTIIDPVGLGQSFSGLMHLSDYEETLINRRIWTQRDQIEERLAELNEHIEKVIQMYLRNEYATITEYNEQAGSTAEKYHFLVVADFPASFSDLAAKRLQSIAISGPRCGVFTLIHWDKRHPIPDGFVPEELHNNALVCKSGTGGPPVTSQTGILPVPSAKGFQPESPFILASSHLQSLTQLTFDPPPPPDLAVDLVHRIGKASIDSNRVQVPFQLISPAPADMWTGDTTHELRIAIGRTGATKHQYLAIGKGTKQHALFAGKTGSGKSTLFHVIITNLAMTCSPDQVEFYLIDFKKGVEFKCYAEHKLPHARVVAIESDREFGLSVLQRVDEELKRRGDIFRKLGCQDIPGYKKSGATEPMPRCLLLIDEFQEFFVDDDAVAQSASLLFDRIVRQGRAFGIHVILGSQTLGGAYTLARATLGQMAIRVALQCNEADAYLIMDENNAAPRLLTRPGEGIYNDHAGALEGNSPFQVCWLGDDERDQCLERVHQLAVQRHDPHAQPIVFEGNAPSDIRENDLLVRALAAKATTAPVIAKAWLGAPNSIKGPTEATFQKQSGNHLLIVGQRDEAALTLIATALVSLAAQYPIGKAKFVLLHGSTPGSAEEKFLDQLTASIPHGVRVSRGNDLADVMDDLSNELKDRNSGEPAVGAPPIFFFIHGLPKFKKLRNEDDFSFDSSASSSPGAQLTDLITEGSTHGLHVIITADTLNNVNRFLNRKTLSEIEQRVLFQMSANDSAALIDSPKAADLGLHRALFYNEQLGLLETFRPYALPDQGWVEEVAALLHRE